MAVLANRAKMSTSTTGTGTISLGSATTGFQTFDNAGITNGQSVQYAIDDGSNFEIGAGTYTSSGTTLSRGATESSNSNNAINLSGTAVVYITAVKAQFDEKLDKSGGAMTGAITTNSTFDGRDVAADGVTADAALPRAGGTMSGVIAMGNNKITGLTNPTANQDGATKAYVDAQIDTADTLSEVLAIGNTTGGTDIAVSTNDKIQFRDTAIFINSSAADTLTIASDGVINLSATTDVVIPADVGLTFGTGEKIEGDSTDLTITSGAKINLTATSDIVVPANVGITFGSGEKIEGDSTDLTITSGAKINLAATTDIHLANNIGMVFGDAGEKIEGDGTNLAINSSGDLNVTATTIDINGNVEISGTTAQVGVSTFSAKNILNAGVSVKNGATSAGFVEFFEDSDNGTNKVTLIGPASTADVTLTLPSAAGIISTIDDATALAIALG